MANMDHSWVVDVKSELNDVDASSELDDIWTKHSIYMVPALIKDLNPKAYKPQIISFGPYHYGDEKLRPMEIHKRRALIHFLKRAQKPLQDFMSALEEVAGVLMDSYESLDGRWREERGEFLRLMLFDGCFMLEVLRFSNGYLRGYTCDYALNDPIFSRHGMSNVMLHIKMDMLRIENQLPLLVLKKLAAAETGAAPDDDDEINQLVLDFMGSRPVPSGVGPGLHTLDLFRKSCLQFPAGYRPAQDDSRQSCLQRTPAAPAQAFLRSCPRGTATRASGRRMVDPETDEDHLATRNDRRRGVAAAAIYHVRDRLPPRAAIHHVRDRVPPRAPGHSETSVSPSRDRVPPRAPGHSETSVSPSNENDRVPPQAPERSETSVSPSNENDRVPPQAPERSETSVSPSKREAVPSASWLVEAGIRFRKSETDSLLDICFADGVLTLPVIIVDDATECEFLNLMAFERLHVGAGNEITSYVFFMDVMVDSAKDVAVLASKGIICKAVGTDKAVAELLNSLGRYVTLDSGSGLRGVLRSVNEYYTRGWNMWRAKMIHFYFKSPLANSVAAFVFLLLLTLLQTVYTVLQYHTRSS